ncbi:hypothetical protein DMUE_2783 [Dictyocoela muelleri]|nr:hypothetical protein DMUE_2783 [Dictyocoela muelleri]
MWKAYENKKDIKILFWLYVEVPKCKSSVSILSDSSLDGKKIHPFIFLRFAFYFFNKNHFTAEYIMKNCAIGEDKYKTLLTIFREKITIFVKANQRQLGNNLKKLQIDKTFWAKRRYGVNDIGKPVWIWGAVEHKSGYCYVQVVKDRSAETLLPLINTHIKKKSYVISDKWPVYNMIKNKFTDKVNHKYYFVDPETKANTQKIENLWLHLKKIKHYSYGISLDTLEDHLNVFMFFHNYKKIEFSDFLMIILNK